VLIGFTSSSSSDVDFLGTDVVVALLVVLLVGLKRRSFLEGGTRGDGSAVDEVVSFGA